MGEPLTASELPKIASAAPRHDLSQGRPRTVRRDWPAILLVAQAVVLLALGSTLDAFRVIPIDMDGYWITVKRLEHGNLHALLTDFRTPGYLVLLKLVSLVSPDLEALPLVHLAIRILAVFAFYAGLRRAGV